MTVKELIEKLEALPQDYQVFYKTEDGYGIVYYAYGDRMLVNHKTKEVEVY